MSIATAIASDLVSPDKCSSAIAMMFHLTVATITGVPLGTWIGQQFAGKHIITIAIIGFLSLVINIISVPTI